MEIARRLRAARRDVRCRQGHRVLQRPPGKLGVASGRPLRDLFSRRRSRSARGAWHREESDYEDRGRVARPSYLRLLARDSRRARERRDAILFERQGREKQKNNNNTKGGPKCAGHFKPPDSFYGRGLREQPACRLTENTLKLLGNHLIALPACLPRNAVTITISRMDHDFGGCAPRATSGTRKRQS